MKPFPNITEAEKIFDAGIKNIPEVEPDAPVDRIKTVNIHSHLVAKAAYLIAQKIPNMDADRAYVLGLLHDYGKLCGDSMGKRQFHGLAGYYKLMEMGYPEIAKLNLTHTFLDKDFDIWQYAAYHPKDLETAKQFINTMEYDDYDRLIQLSDLLVNNVDGFNTIEERMLRVKKWYALPQSNVDITIQQAEALRKYFENKCGCDIYSLLGIKGDNNEQKTNSSRS